MKTVVLIKQVPDTETKIRIKADQSGIETDGIKYILSPYDEFAVEEALKTKEKAGGEVVVMSLGPARCVEAIRTALAMGADRGIHIDDAGLNNMDSFVTAKILAAALKNESPNVVFCGKQAIDDDSAQVPQMVAEFLNMPQVMIVEKFELNATKNGATVSRKVGGGSTEVYDIEFPAIFGAEKGLNTPRYASLPGIMKAKTKPLATLKASDLLGEAKPKTTNVNFRLPPERKAGKVLQGEPEQVVKELVKLLREEAKVI
ncbi:MAG TPA: electron transfer flavoprotein subunit beta/FixA family protein [bacterium]|nr:electron transfer flavoprotein subunit beta/FixA family protein [bacterium]